MGSGRVPTCLCGKCEKCKNRVYNQAWHKKIRKPKGPQPKQVIPRSTTFTDRCFKCRAFCAGIVCDKCLEKL